ncbi:hypothetical protein TcWFU_000899 [Taenia crassiceps]|uniref:Uncharacterized protein n=1 Tax=Taenia crassiceps TaxID=6207 RepID=A0ABR4Q561_9CEST
MVSGLNCLFRPPNEVVRRDRQWNYLDSPLNLIPIPRAPTPTFGEVTPRPQVWHKGDAFFPVLPNGSITVHGPSNYILQVSGITSTKSITPIERTHTRMC